MLKNFKNKIISFFQASVSNVKVKPLPTLPETFVGILGNLALYRLVQEFEFESVLDVGTGRGTQADLFESYGKVVTRFDLGMSRSFEHRSDVIVGDFVLHDFGDKKFDLIWASHVLEHSLEPHRFLCKIRRLTNKNGIVAITVPPAKPEFVGGHLSMWTPALLTYHMVLAGFDCKHAVLLRYGYNISILLKNEPSNIDLNNLRWDYDDIKRIARWLPDYMQESIDGDITGEVFEGYTRFFR